MVKTDKVNSKGIIMYTIYCEFEYNGYKIIKKEGGIQEKDMHSEERYIGKKYSVYYYPKYDYMLVEKEYKKALH